MVNNMLFRSSYRMYNRKPVNLRLSKYAFDVRFYPVSSHFPTRHLCSRPFPNRFEDGSPHTFEDSSATLLIWFSPNFMIEKLGKIEIFKLNWCLVV